MAAKEVLETVAGSLPRAAATAMAAGFLGGLGFQASELATEVAKGAGNGLRKWWDKPATDAPAAEAEAPAPAAKAEAPPQ